MISNLFSPSGPCLAEGPTVATVGALTRAAARKVTSAVVHAVACTTGAPVHKRGGDSASCCDSRTSPSCTPFFTTFGETCNTPLSCATRAQNCAMDCAADFPLAAAPGSCSASNAQGKFHKGFIKGWRMGLNRGLNKGMNKGLGRIANAAKHSGFKGALFGALNAVLLVCALSVSQSAGAQAITNSSLYYRLGGSSPFGGTLNRNQAAVHLGVQMRVNLSCGKFDLSLSWNNLMNEISNLGKTFSSAIQGAIAALPSYILQRAEPGLYQLLTTYSAQVDLLLAAALKNCQQMEQEIAKGGDPYADFVAQAKNIQWRAEVTKGGDILAAQDNIETKNSGQKAGLPWVCGVNAGGLGQAPIRPVNDLAVAGYQIACGVPNPNCTTAVTTSAICPSTARLSKIFPTPKYMSEWASDVLGDRVIYTCDTDDCPGQSTASDAGSTAVGLMPKIYQEIDFISPILYEVLADPSKSAKLADVSAEGYAISPQVMEAMRRMPTAEQTLVMNRVIREAAYERVTEKANMVVTVLNAALSIPDAYKTVAAQNDVRAKIDRLTSLKQDLFFEFKVRKEMSSETALTVLRDAQFQDSLGNFQRPGQGIDNPIINGAVHSP